MKPSVRIAVTRGSALAPVLWLGVIGLGNATVAVFVSPWWVGAACCALSVASVCAASGLAIYLAVAKPDALGVEKAHHES